MPRMRNLAFVLAVVALSSFAACSKSGPPPETVPASGGEATPGGEPGTPAPTAMTCSTDDDCVVSCARPSECCDQLCPPCEQIFNKEAFAALDKWKGEHCAAVSCPMAKCMAPKEQTVARCTSGTCTIDRVPVAN
jgi:hypothetical protein